MRDRVLRYVLNNQVLSAIIVIAIVYLIIQIRDVLVALFVSYIITAAIEPYVDYLRRNRVPKPIAIIVPYIIGIGILLLLILALVPFLIAQIQLLFEKFPSYLRQDVSIWGVKLSSLKIDALVAKELENLGRNAFATASLVFGGVISVISVFAVSFYLLLYRESVKRGLASIFPQSFQKKVESAIVQVEDKLGAWLRGQIVLSFFIGVTSWIILTAIGVDFALPLAVLAGMLEIVPTIGPIISAIPAVIVALNTSPLLAGIVALSYFFIQLFENNVLVPRIMQRAVGLNPIIIILGIIIGGKLLGVSGALLAIPFISLIVVVYKNLE